MRPVPSTRSNRRSILGLLLLALLFGAVLILATVAAPSAATAAPGGDLTLDLEPYVDGGEIDSPTALANAGDERLFVVERGGRILVVQDGGNVLQTPFLDISDRVEWQSHGERGLLGLVFHPDYAQNGYFYVNYTAQVGDGDTHIARFEVTDNPNVADEGSEETILVVQQPFGNHNAGDLAFGPQDGYLYIPLGDGGSGNDPDNRAQNAGVLLGKLLRVDVDMEDGAPADCGTPGAYTIPDDNPLVDGPGGDCDEIWALGLRNPWRISFDRQTHDLYIGDVGQNAWEEVNQQPAASAGGENYGWSCYEGAHLNPNTEMPACEPAAAYDMPIFEYAHEDNLGCAVTGGYVYRGSQYPSLAGRYVLTDSCSGYFWDLDVDNGWQATRHDGLQQFGFTTFGQAADGELYVADANNGRILHVTVVTARVYLPVVGRE